MATLTATPIVVAGVAYSLVAVAPTGDKFINSEKEFIAIKNGHATLPRTVTIAAQKKCDYHASHDISVTIAAGVTKLVGPMPVKWFNDSTDYCNITYSDAGADLTIGVFQL